jgi:hypothetical protein
MKTETEAITINIEAREWLAGPGERDLIYGGKGYEDFGSKLVESLYDAGAVKVYVHKPYESGGGHQFADTLHIVSTPNKEGDVLIALAAYHPDETHRLKLKIRNRKMVRAWWD